ncbi:putative phosphoprotein phosphatase [Corchorus olitorius]|uniref:Phosphoprotein phosphatase n=1 Tax=Corchorus olitorius TaxID=93759 RepID=A0A1R3JW16_9ROSI|nr:putative phosphoprotein phosphatase [Corchorus olitorius]
MTRLTRMGIFCCQMIREIVACERQDVKEVITFADLEILELGELPSLLCFCSGSVAFEFHSLKEVMVRECQYMMRFSQKKSSTPMLKGVKFTRRVNEVRSDDNLENTIKQMFMEEVGYSKHLKLSESSNFELIEIWRQNPRENFDFKSLKFLEICDCSTLTCLLTISMAMDLPQLQDLKVKDAKLMEHIMIDEGPDEEVLTISFPRLTSITLESCSNITSFYKGSKMLQCKSLTRITVKDCPQMFAFAYTISREQIIIEKIDGAGNLVSRVADAFVAPFFNDKVELPSLGVLQLSPFMKKTILPSDKLQRLWHDQTLGKSCYFLNLKILKLEGSEEGGIIIKAFPKLGTMELNSLPKLLRFCYGDSIVFPMLHDLRIENCPEFTTFVSNFVIGYEGQVDPNVDVLCLFNDKVAFPTLQKLEILRQFKWKKMWHDKLTPNSFAKLKHLKLEKCDGLSSIFPSSMVDRLQKLNLMEISRCDDLESIIEPFHSTESSPKFVFSRVRWLKLESLSKLKSFYPIMHTTQWPSLKKLIVNGCTNVKIFAQEINSQALHIPSEQPLFWFSKETFPCLKKLKTDQDGAKEILELTNYQGVKFVGEDEDDYYSYYYCT